MHFDTQIPHLHKNGETVFRIYKLKNITRSRNTDSNHIQHALIKFLQQPKLIKQNIK